MKGEVNTRIPDKTKQVGGPVTESLRELALDNHEEKTSLTETVRGHWRWSRGPLGHMAMKVLHLKACVTTGDTEEPDYKLKEA